MSKATVTAPTITFANRHQQMMPKIDIELGSQVQIKFNPIGGQSQYTFPAVYIGVMHYKFLAINMPFVSGIKNHLLPGTMVEIQYQLEGALHSFRTDVLAHTMKPVFVLFLGYPDRMSVLAMRVHKRSFCALPCTLECELDEAGGIIVDISAGGCRILTSLSGNPPIKDIERDTELTLTTNLSAAVDSVSTVGIVRNVAQEGAYLSIGIVFGDNKEFLEALQEFLALMADLPQR